MGKLLLKSSSVTLLGNWLKKLATFNPLPIFHRNGSGSVTVTSECHFKNNENATKNNYSSYVVGPFLPYILSVVGVIMLKCSASNDIVTIPKELYKTCVKQESIFAVNKKVTK